MSNEKLGAEQGRRWRVAKAIWENEAEEAILKKAFPRGYEFAKWPELEESLRQPYCQSTYRAADAVLAAMTEQAYHAWGAGRAAALEEVRRMLEEQRKECLNETVSMGLNRIRADELDNALINLRALAAEPGADTGTTLPLVTPEMMSKVFAQSVRRKDPDHQHIYDHRIAAELLNKMLAAAERGTTPPEGLRDRILELKEHCVSSGNSTWDDCEPIIYLRKRDVLAALAATQRAPVGQVQPAVANIDLPRNEFEAAWAHYASTAPGTATEKNVFMAGWNAAAPDHAREGALRDLVAKWRGLRGVDWGAEPDGWKVTFNVCADELERALADEKEGGE